MTRAASAMASTSWIGEVAQPANRAASNRLGVTTSACGSSWFR